MIIRVIGEIHSGKEVAALQTSENIRTISVYRPPRVTECRRCAFCIYREANFFLGVLEIAKHVGNFHFLFFFFFFITMQIARIVLP